MAKPFDATLNDLIGVRPDDWASHFARLVGIPAGPSESLDTDLATTVQADRVFRINGPRPALLHLELEANPRLGIPRDLLRYNTLIDHQYELPVETVLVLMRPKARASDMTGRYVRAGVGGNAIVEFCYHVERVWERPADHWLNAGLGLLPLSLLTDEATADLEPAVGKFRDALYAATPDESLRQRIIGSSYFLSGLRYDQAKMVSLFERFSMTLEDSTTYQATIAKGVAQGMAQGRILSLRETVLRLGTKKFGPPPVEVKAALDGIADVMRLEELSLRALDAADWADLMRDG